MFVDISEKIVSASFIGGGSRSTPRETTNLPQVADKTLSYKLVSSTIRHERDSNS